MTMIYILPHSLIRAIRQLTASPTSDPESGSCEFLVWDTKRQQLFELHQVVQVLGHGSAQLLRKAAEHRERRLSDKPVETPVENSREGAYFE